MNSSEELLKQMHVLQMEMRIGERNSDDTRLTKSLMEMLALSVDTKVRTLKDLNPLSKILFLILKRRLEKEVTKVIETILNGKQELVDLKVAYERWLQNAKRTTH